MLVLSRKLDEVILIGDDIRIEVTTIDRGRVKLGIDAPQHVRILRAELLEQKGSSDGYASPVPE